MKQGLTIRQAISGIRADIAAILMISFIFQLVVPVLVLANTPDEETAFETALRNSICRVVVNAEHEENNKTSPPITDRFVCDLCILCSTDVLERYDPLPEVVFHKPLAGHPPAKGSVETDRLTSLVNLSEATPRAPPVML